MTEGVYNMPGYLSHEAQDLISRMLAVDPVKRITVPEILQHPFFTADLPRYLQPLPPKPTVLPTLSSLVTPPVKALDFEMIDGLGRIEEDVVDELAARMEGVDKEDVWESLRRDDGPQGNAVKVAYMLLRDKRRLGRDREHTPLRRRRCLTCSDSCSFRRARTRCAASCDGRKLKLAAVYYPLYTYDPYPATELAVTKCALSGSSRPRRESV